MHFISRSIPAAVALIILGALLLPGAALAVEPFKCSTCHTGLGSGSVPHKPVAAGQCLRCHQQLSDNHPLGKESMTFVVQKDKLCLSCHTTLLKAETPMLHKPVGEGKCTGCHMHHASNNKSLLKDPAPKLCFRCHPQNHFSGTHGHPPVAKGECLSCHDAHQAGTRYLLKKPGSELCFMCHDRQKFSEGKSVHGPIKTGECVRCHMVHGSPYRKILKADMPTELYRPFTTDAFPLCFSCHKPELASEVKTDNATNFRNGTRNLHAVHVNKSGKGRSCKICHNPHVSPQDRLVQSKAPGFGSWEIPIHFNITPTGGGCSVGCHQTFRYDRVNPVTQQ
jgi:predicted CXXCH cytochrome family protein